MPALATVEEHPVASHDCLVDRRANALVEGRFGLRRIPDVPPQVVLSFRNLVLFKDRSHVTEHMDLRSQGSGHSGDLPLAADRKACGRGTPRRGALPAAEAWASLCRCSTRPRRSGRHSADSRRLMA